MNRRFYKDSENSSKIVEDIFMNAELKEKSIIERVVNEFALNREQNKKDEVIDITYSEISSKNNNNH